MAAHTLFQTADAFCPNAKSLKAGTAETRKKQKKERKRGGRRKDAKVLVWDTMKPRTYTMDCFFLFLPFLNYSLTVSASVSQRFSFFFIVRCMCLLRCRTDLFALGATFSLANSPCTSGLPRVSLHGLLGVRLRCLEGVPLHSPVRQICGGGRGMGKWPKLMCLRDMSSQF